MNFYEELGVPPDAPPDTIREAYRNVARLMHPDAQTNPVLKESAEVQMKRINQLYDTLSDPERRRRYDQELGKTAERPGTIIIHAPAHHSRSSRGRQETLVWFAVTAACTILILWLATREPVSPAVYPRSGQGDTAAAPLAPPSTATAQKSRGERWRDDEISRLRAELSAVNADRERLAKQIAMMESERGERKFQPPASPQKARITVPEVQNPGSLAAAHSMPFPPIAPLEVALPAVAPPPAPKSKWAGSWQYVPAPADRRRAALFPPEFIETVIVEDNGRLHGQYHARFKVGSAKISPDVNYRFEGTIAGWSGRLTWSGSGGANGEVQLHLVSESSLEVTWSADYLGTSMGLASGTAVLSRRK